MKIVIFRNSRCSGNKIEWYRTQVTAEDIVITKITAMLIPRETSICRETPKKEQSAMKRIRRILFIKTAEKKMPNRLTSFIKFLP